MVSVAMCTYNGEAFLKKQLDSIVNQTYPHIELIVCDDGSTDSTIDILEEYKRESERPMLIVNNLNNLGYYRNFEKAISLCNGYYIALADQDDIWHTNKLKHLVLEIDDNELIYCNSEVINEHGEDQNIFLSELFNFTRGSESKSLLFNNCVSAHAMLFKKELLQFALPFPDFKFHDWWIAYVAMSVGKIEYTDEVLVKYRVHNSNNTDIKKYTTFKKLPKKKGKTKNKWGAFKGNRDVLSLLKMFEQFSFHRPEEKKFLRKFKEAQLSRENQIISWPYYLLWKQYGGDLLACRKMSKSKKRMYIRNKLLGMKFKKLYYQLRGKYDSRFDSHSDQ